MKEYEKAQLKKYLEKMYSAALKGDLEKVREINLEFSHLEHKLFDMSTTHYDLARNEIINSFQKELSKKGPLKRAKRIIDSL